MSTQICNERIFFGSQDENYDRRLIYSSQQIARRLIKGVRHRRPHCRTRPVEQREAGNSARGWNEIEVPRMRNKGTPAPHARSRRRRARICSHANWVRWMALRAPHMPCSSRGLAFAAGGRCSQEKPPTPHAPLPCSSHGPFPRTRPCHCLCWPRSSRWPPAGGRQSGGGTLQEEEMRERRVRKYMGPEDEKHTVPNESCVITILFVLYGILINKL
jgi:hypothetical protein